MTGYAENAKLDVSVPTAQIGPDYEARRTDAFGQIEALNITKRIISTCKYDDSSPDLYSPVLAYSETSPATTHGWWHHAEP